MTYLRDPQAIYDKSFATIRSEADFSHLPANAEDVAIRVLHACGMIDAVADLVISPDLVPAAIQALKSGKPILVDAEMVRHGIIARTLPHGVEVICTLNDPAVPGLAATAGTTRSAAAIELWKPHLAGAIVVVGNAPTALFALLEALDAGAARPSAIIAFPVGFVGAAESKEEVIANPRGIPFAAIKGRRGGSAMAAAVVNALSAGLA